MLVRRLKSSVPDPGPGFKSNGWVLIKRDKRDRGVVMHVVRNTEQVNDVKPSALWWRVSDKWKRK